jgi:CheY-like chemotaxis protein
VDARLTEWLAAHPDVRPSPEVFEQFLRREYPSVTVREQEQLATLGPQQVWYVERRRIPGADLFPAPNAAAPGALPVYSTARVAQMVGLPVSVLVAWDEGENLVRPYRTPGSQVLYSRDDLEAVLFVKRGFVEGREIDEVRQALAARRAGGSAATGGQPPGRKLLVLLAERDRYAAEFSEYFLRTEGYEVEVALSAAEAETTAEALRPELAVVELLISGGAGAELCARLKATTDAAVLAISSMDASDVALRAGADAFLAKPYDALAFVSAVKDLLGESAILRRSTGAGEA